AGFGLVRRGTTCTFSTPTSGDPKRAPEPGCGREVWKVMDGEDSVARKPREPTPRVGLAHWARDRRRAVGIASIPAGRYGALLIGLLAAAALVQALLHSWQRSSAW